MELVEVSVLPGAPAHIAARAFAVADALGKQPIAVPPDPGFVVNRVLFPLLFEAARLHERTRLEPSALDACVTLGAGHPMGPLALLDLIGLDVASAIGVALELPVPEVIADHVAAGALGRKSGAGFYTYTA
jgi:3-hydroxybutyryl-CoA dehydrogenase